MCNYQCGITWMEKSQSAPAVLQSHILDKKQYIDSNKIGEGTFGTVFRIPSPELDQKSNAVKVCKSLLARETLQKEWNILSALDHPNIVRVLGDLFVTPSRSLMVMEDIQGNDLLELLVRGYTSSLAAIHITQSILRALEYIHNNDYIHKDLKAENILIGASDIRDVSLATTVKLCDFGLSCHRQSVSIFNRVGSLDYCAPEVRLGVIKDPYKLDIYSFSVLFFVVCHCEMPIEVTREVDNGGIVSKENYRQGIMKARSRRDHQFSNKHFRSVYKHSSSLHPKRRYTATALLGLKVFTDKFLSNLVDPSSESI